MGAARERAAAHLRFGRRRTPRARRGLRALRARASPRHAPGTSSSGSRTPRPRSSRSSEMHERDRRRRPQRSAARDAPRRLATRDDGFRALPAALRRVGAGRGRPVAPTEYSARLPARRDGDPAPRPGRVSIRYPLDGARFVLDPDRRRESPGARRGGGRAAGTAEVALLVDGARSIAEEPVHAALAARRRATTSSSRAPARREPACGIHVRR